MAADSNEIIEQTVIQVLAEDLSEDGDITSNALFSEDDEARAVIRSKAFGVLSGSTLLQPVFQHCHPGLIVTNKLGDGDALTPGAVIAHIQGPIKGICAGERVCLNFLQRLSGIASITSQYVTTIAHTSARLLDTRKTTPGLRYFEKKAVCDGGGCNHRFGLFDMMLIKDTHIKHCGGVLSALERAFQYRNTASSLQFAIEIEVQSVLEFSHALTRSPDRIMLDNMPLEEMSYCVNERNRTGSTCEVEASGNITLETIASVAETGVDYISVGALTHSAPSLDIHLIIQ